MLLPLLDDELALKQDRQFFMIHLMGSHFHYNKRYPPEYEHFTSEHEHSSSALHKNIQAEYDNSILYNDFVVTEIISRFRDENAIVVYIADHGEETSDNMDFIGHGEGMLDRDMIEVPMIIWLSNQFSETYPELEYAIASSIHRPYMTDDMIHTLLDLMNIETSEYVPSRSIINPDFDSSRPRIYAGHIYDKESGLHEVR